MLKISKLLLSLSFLILLGFLVFAYFQYQAFSGSLEDARRAQAKMLSESAMGVIRHFHSLSAGTGKLTDEQAQHYAMRALESATYADNGYFWINDLEGLMLMHPYSPELVGTTLFDITDDQGTYLFREFSRVAQSGGGWVSYTWPKPGSTESYQKVSYISYFEPWDWVLGNGVYLDDMEAQIFSKVVSSSGLVFLLFSIFLIGSVFWIDIFVKRLQDSAVRDKLTGLYNKRFLKAIVPNLLRNESRLKKKVLAVTFMDIDHFKHINDTYGHAVGDEVLRRMGHLVSRLTRPTDYCVRYGGEEILVLGFYASIEAAARAADRIRLAFADHAFTVDNAEFTATVSAGVAAHKPNGESIEDTLQEADKKMYESKESGRNQVSF